MLLAFVLLLAGVVVGVLRGGSLENINRVRFRLPWLVFLGLALQIGVDAAAARFPGIRGGVAGPLILAISYGLVGTFVVLNFRFPGAPLIGLGLILNLSVILANGAMPVSLWAMKVSGSHAATHLQNSVKHQAMGRHTRLGFLGDIIPVPPLGIVSVGDVVLGAGVFLLVTYLMAPDKHRKGNDRNSNDRNSNSLNGKSLNGDSLNGDSLNGNHRSEEGPDRHSPNAPEPPPFSGCRWLATADEPFGELMDGQRRVAAVTAERPHVRKLLVVGPSRDGLGRHVEDPGDICSPQVVVVADSVSWLCHCFSFA